MVEDYKQLRIWQQSIELAKLVYMLVDLLPDKERYGLRSQLTRAVVSIATNIAEGSRRKTTKDLTNFLTIALGSLAEVETQIIIAILRLKLDCYRRHLVKRPLAKLTNLRRVS